jgi:hypothetical protein
VTTLRPTDEEERCAKSLAEYIASITTMPIAIAIINSTSVNPFFFISY